MKTLEKVDFIKLDKLTIHPQQVKTIIDVAKELEAPSPKRRYSYKTLDIFVGHKLTKTEADKYRMDVLAIHGSKNAALVSFVRRYNGGTYGIVYFTNEDGIKENEVTFGSIRELKLKLK